MSQLHDIESVGPGRHAYGGTSDPSAKDHRAKLGPAARAVILMKATRK
jgi:hypothetical protein